MRCNKTNTTRLFRGCSQTTFPSVLATGLPSRIQAYHPSPCSQYFGKNSFHYFPSTNHVVFVYYNTTTCHHLCHISSCLTYIISRLTNFIPTQLYGKMDFLIMCMLLEIMSHVCSYHTTTVSKSLNGFELSE